MKKVKKMGKYYQFGICKICWKIVPTSKIFYNRELDKCCESCYMNSTKIYDKSPGNTKPVRCVK